MTEPAPSTRGAIDPFVVMEVVAAANELERATDGDVLHLEVGQPSTGAPSRAVAAAQACLAAGHPLGYTQAAGLPELRTAIARLYDRRYGVAVDPDAVMVTVGASGACVLAILAAFDPGDRVVVTEPGYPCYRQMLTATGVTPAPVRVGPADDFRLAPRHLDDAREHGPIRGVMIASPANPTGTVLDRAGLDAIAAWCDEQGAWLISDEIYHGIVFDQPATTAATSDHAIVIGSFSKYFSMTGWRLGWMIVPPALRDAVDRLQQNLFLCPPTLSQHAALGALDPGAAAELDGHVERYRHNRELLVAGLGDLGLDTFAPADGAFYVWANTECWHPDSRTLAAEWLTDLHVATTPGIDFDPVDGPSWMRFSVSGSTSTVEEALARLSRWESSSRSAHAPPR